VHRAALLLHFDALQPLGETFRDIFLKKSLLSDSAMETFHGNGAPTNVGQHHGGNQLVVRGEFALGNAVVGEQNFVGMRDQRASRTTSRAALSLRMPRNRGCRSLPNFVHSM